MKAPGDVYERSAADAKQLTEHGIVAAVTVQARKPKRTRAK
jgi:hypothetical protein